MNINLQEGSFTYYLSKLYHTILPALTLGLLSTAGYIQYLRNDIIDNANKDYVLTAKAKGLTINKIYNKHILRNSLIPLLLFRADIVSILGGAVITETIFHLMVLVNYFRICNRSRLSINDGINPVLFILGLFGNLISDITYNFVDPRIRSN